MFKRYLLAPGPTPVPSEVLLAMAAPIRHHRSPDFLPVLDSAKKGLQWLYQTKNDVLILSSTGTGGMVGAVNNFFNKDDKVLVINGGKFGERWTKICQSYGLDDEEIIVEWGYAVKPDEVEKRLKKYKNIKGEGKYWARQFIVRPRHSIEVHYYPYLKQLHQMIVRKTI